MGERVLGLALDRRGPDPADQLLGLQLGQPGPDGRLGGPGERGQGARPEDPAGHGRVLDQRLAAGREHVEPGRDQGLDGVGEGDGGGGQPHHGPERTSRPRSVSSRTNSSAYSGLPPARSSSGAWTSAGSTDWPSRSATSRAVSASVSGGSGDGGGAGDPAAPARLAVEQLRPGGGDHQQGGPGRPGAQVLEELEHRRVGPVQVLDHQHQRMVAGHGLHEPAPGGERLRALDPGRLGVDQAEQRGDAGLEPLLVGGSATSAATAASSLAGDLGRVVGLEDAGLGLDDLAQGPEGDPVAIGQAAALAPGDQLRPVVQEGRQLSDQAALADAGGAGHRSPAAACGPSTVCR